MSDDFERAVLLTFNFTGAVEPALKERATTFVNEIKKSPECWRLCTERFSSSPYPEVKFWCLQTLHEIIRASFAKLDTTAKGMIKTTMLTWLQRDCNDTQNPLPAFLRNKLAQTVVSVVQLEYPHDWPTFFQDLIRALSQGEGLIDMFCRILVSIDEDLVSLDIPRSQDESRLSMHVKDSMREHSITDVAAAWYQLVEAFHVKNPDLTITVLQTMQRYISWIDINLVANDKFITLLESLMDPPHTPALRGAAAECLTEIVSKRMEAVPKLMLVKSMSIVPRCAAWAAGLCAAAAAERASAAAKGETAGGLDDVDEDEHELRVKLAKLLSTLALEVMDSLKRVENSVISMTAMGFAVDDEALVEVSSATEVANSLMNALFPTVLGAFNSHVDDISLPLLPFMSAYMARLKALHKRSQGVLSPEALSHVRTILEGLALCSRFPADSKSYPGAPSSASQAAAAREEQGEVDEKRRDLFTLFKNIAKIAFPETLAFVGALLQQATTQPKTTFQDVEVAVALLYELGEGAPEEALKPDSGALGQLALGLMLAAPQAVYSHRLVALVVLETYVRYGRVMQAHQHIIPNAIMTFLDERGMGHPSEDVSTRACYLFCRLVKSLRSNLRPFLGTILQALQVHLVRVATTPLADQMAGPNASAGGVPGAGGPPSRGMAVASMVDDRLYVFEAVGLLLGQDELAAEEQANALNALLQPLAAQIESNLTLAAQAQQGQAPPGSAVAVAAAPGLILQAMEAVVRLSKGFRTELVTRTRPQLGRMFVRCLEAAIQVPRVYPTNKVLRARFISSVHRMVECLTSAMLPYLPAALEVLVTTQVDAPDLVDVMALINQLILRFKEALLELLQGLLPVMIARLHSILDNNWDWSGKLALPAAMAGSATATLEESREKGELQRAYYLMLHVIVHNGLSVALLKSPPQALDVAIKALTQGATLHIDATVRRTCIQVFERLLNDWCDGNGNEVAPGFQRFAMEHLGGEACVAGVLRPGSGLDMRDPSSLALLGEVAMALKLVYAKCGDEFPALLCSSVLPALGCPADVQQQLVYHVRESEAKDLKEYLRQILQRAQQQQQAAQQQKQMPK